MRSFLALLDTILNSLTAPVPIYLISYALKAAALIIPANTAFFRSLAAKLKLMDILSPYSHKTLVNYGWKIYIGVVTGDSAKGPEEITRFHAL